MNALLLEPADVLFFRDGRPMTGSLTGHGAAWPLPHTLHAALHAALHRTDLPGHEHREDGGGPRTRRYGSLQSAGPFPVKQEGRHETWYFPRPLDTTDDSGLSHLAPVPLPGPSSLPAPLTHAVQNTRTPSKQKPAGWWAADKFASYLAGKNGERAPAANDAEIFDAEHAIGIGISPETGSQDGERFYTASYLRLRPEWSLGALAATDEKSGPDERHDLIAGLFEQERHLVTGGQQRVCHVTSRKDGLDRLPRGLADGFASVAGKHRVKWVMLTPAIFPEITDHSGATSHTGGWLPTWIDPKTGSVLLPRGDRTRLPREPRETWRARIAKTAGFGSAARLVAAVTGKPIPITGWSLEHGAKSTHLAVPAGCVYYFECDSADAARDLAAALNWHGVANGRRLVNRRSGIFGEKGFGLGICGTW